jgi:alanyl-tRNA synthetase
MGVQEAVAAGALAFFGDKYGDQVRVVSVNTFSQELCGGTHCRQTGEIGLFRLVSETGVAAGVRRIECMTGSGAFLKIKKIEHEVKELAEMLKAAPSELVQKTKRLLAQLKEKERELEQVRLKMASGAQEDATARTVKGIRIHAQRVDGMEAGELRALADQLRDQLKSGVIALGGVKEGKVSLLVVVTKDLTGKLKAGELIKEMAGDVGGTGGGRSEMAQAGGKNPEGVDMALDKIFELVERTVGK